MTSLTSKAWSLCRFSPVILSQGHGIFWLLHFSPNQEPFPIVSQLESSSTSRGQTTTNDHNNDQQPNQTPPLPSTTTTTTPHHVRRKKGRSHHRNHRTGRILPRRTPSLEGLHGKLLCSVDVVDALLCCLLSFWVSVKKNEGH